jgi:hypothetical protein
MTYSPDSSSFCKSYFFEDAAVYPLLDKTNRHGILHGAYREPLLLGGILSGLDESLIPAMFSRKAYSERTNHVDV